MFKYPEHEVTLQTLLCTEYIGNGLQCERLSEIVLECRRYFCCYKITNKNEEEIEALMKLLGTSIHDVNIKKKY